MRKKSFQKGKDLQVIFVAAAAFFGVFLLLPLVLLLAGAMLGQAAFAGAGEELVALSGALGLSLGFLVVRVMSRRFREDVRFQPVVLRRVGDMLFKPQ